MMPAAIENRNEVFITDHGSSRDSRSRAFRVRRATPTFGLWPVAVSGWSRGRRDRRQRLGRRAVDRRRARVGRD